MALVGSLYHARLLHPWSRNNSCHSIPAWGLAAGCNGRASRYGSSGIDAMVCATTLPPRHAWARVDVGHCSRPAGGYDSSDHSSGHAGATHLPCICKFGRNDWRPYRPVCQLICEWCCRWHDHRLRSMATPAALPSGSKLVGIHHGSSYGPVFGCLCALVTKHWLRRAGSLAANDECNWSYCRGGYRYHLGRAVTKVRKIDKDKNLV